jgi:hypothetical protein
MPPLDDRGLAPIHPILLIGVLASLPLFSDGALVTFAVVCTVVSGVFTAQIIRHTNGLCVSCDLLDRTGLVAMLGSNVLLISLVALRAFQVRITPFWRGLCLLIPAGQLILLSIGPKLCPACVATGISAEVVYYLCKTESGKHRWLPVIACSLVFVLAASAATTQRSPTGHGHQHLAGVNAESVGLSGDDSRIPRVYLLTSRGCHWCQESRNWLKSHNVAFSELDILSAQVNRKVVDISVAPQLFLVRGRTVSHHLVGFGADAYEAIRGEL